MSVENLSSHLSLSGLPGIPWQYSHMEGLKVWAWDTEHFKATIMGDGNKYIWNVLIQKEGDNTKSKEKPPPEQSRSNASRGVFMRNDKKEQFLEKLKNKNNVDIMAGDKTEIFAEGGGRNFSDAERQIRECVGKSFAEVLGYKKWAGVLAHTFTISTGQRVNFEPFVGNICELTLVKTNPDGTTSEVVYSGVLSVQNYDLILDTGKHILRIKPGSVVSVTSSSVNEAKTENHSRVMEGSVVLGCTGRTGFKLGTIQHTGAKCPIHEE